MGYGGRQRAGHGCTFVKIGDHYEKIIFTDKGRWALTQDAMGWPRCSHCRRPYQVATFGFPVCCTCFYYKGGYLEDVQEFWRLTKAKHPLAGYVIGDGFTRSMNCGFLTLLNQHVSSVSELRFYLGQQPDWVVQHWEGDPPKLGPLAIAMETRRAETTGSVAKR